MTIEHQIYDVELEIAERECRDEIARVKQFPKLLARCPHVLATLEERLHDLCAWRDQLRASIQASRTVWTLTATQPSQPEAPPIPDATTVAQMIRKAALRSPHSLL